jgi:hypothetical protein
MRLHHFSFVTFGMLLMTAAFRAVALLAAAPEIVQTIILNTCTFHETRCSLQSHSLFPNRYVNFLSLAKPLFWRWLAAKLAPLFFPRVCPAPGGTIFARSGRNVVLTAVR